MIDDKIIKDITEDNPFLDSAVSDLLNSFKNVLESTQSLITYAEMAKVPTLTAIVENHSNNIAEFMHKTVSLSAMIKMFKDK